MDAHPLVIIGAGLAGWTTAREFRKLSPTSPVLLVCADAGDFYAKPSLSNALAQKRTPQQLVSTAAPKMAQSLNVTLLAHTTVLAVNPVAQTITTAQGDFSYRQLVLATGAQAIRVPMAGNAADQVVSVNSLADFTRFHAQLTTPNGGSRHVAIMGAGLIGCEFANDLVVAGHQVSVIDPSSRPLATLLPIDASMQLQEALASVGVAWHWGATVRSVDLATVTADTEATPAFTLQLSTGQTLSADLVLSAIGLKADLTLAQQAGLVCDRGIVVNRSLQTSAPDVYALGDSAQYASAGNRTLPFVMPIMSAAKALAATLAGTPIELVFPPMPVAIKTPTLPIVVAPPELAAPGEWCKSEDGVWHFIDATGALRGFVLTGRQTTRRAELARSMITL